MTQQHDEFPAELVERVRDDINAARFLRAGQPVIPLEDPRNGETEYCTALALAALRALRDAGALVPEGWVAVPREATYGMQHAVAKLAHTRGWDDLHQSEIYRTMLTAAPRAGGGDE